MTDSSAFRLSLIQMSFEGSVDATRDKAETLVRQAAAEGAQVVCLQELFASQYPCQSEDHRRFDLAESIDGPSVQRMQALAKTFDLAVVVPIFERRAPGLFHNTAVVIDAGGEIAGVYRKMHIPDDPLYYEKFYFTPGDAGPSPKSPNGFRSIPTKHAKLGVGICWDQWYPETARLLALTGADCLLFPTAIGWIDDEKQTFGESQLDAWLTIMRSHAIANGLFVGTVNRVGVEGRIEFWGNSFIAGPHGQMLARSSKTEDEIIHAVCVRDEIETTRTHWPFLRDRRVDAYGELTSRWRDE